MQGRIHHEKVLRKQAYLQLQAASNFNLGIIRFLSLHAAGTADQVAASVAAAVDHLRLEQATAAAQQQLAQGCARKLFASFSSDDTLAAITVVSKQQHC